MITTMQEYDLEIKLDKLVKGQGLCKLVVESHDNKAEDHEEWWEKKPELLEKEICYIPIPTNSWYYELNHYIIHGTAPNYLDARNKRYLRLNGAKYQLINNVLFRKNQDITLLRCLEEDDSRKMLTQLHDGPSGGHFGGDTTTHKILREGYYWLTLLKYAHAYACKCFIYQTCPGRQSKPVNPLEHVIIDESFQQWGIDVIGDMNPRYSMQHKYILTAIDYFTRWVEAVPMKQVNTNKVIEFLEYNITTGFCTPLTLVFDNASYFSSIAVSQFSLDRGIQIRYSTNYYPKGNGMAESNINNLI